MKCEQCGTEFEAKSKCQKYCCIACRKEAIKIRRRGKYYSHEKYASRRQRLISAGLCDVCGKEKARQGKRTCFHCAVKIGQRRHAAKENRMM